MYKVALWGIGDGYNLFSQLKGYEMVEVVVITDRNCSHISTMDGKPVVEPRRLKEYEFDYLVVSVIDDKIYKLIIEDALSIGIAREIILPLRIFQIPFFDFDKYIKIKESNISIISDYCFGGYLYHRFGLKFMTPTINMYADNDNYYRFISNLKYYMSIEME